MKQNATALHMAEKTVAEAVACMGSGVQLLQDEAAPVLYEPRQVDLAHALLVIVQHQAQSRRFRYRSEGAKKVTGLTNSTFRQ